MPLIFEYAVIASTVNYIKTQQSYAELKNDVIFINSSLLVFFLLFF